jgi:hypothetical protein
MKTAFLLSIALVTLMPAQSSLAGCYRCAGTGSCGDATDGFTFCESVQGHCSVGGNSCGWVDDPPLWFHGPQPIVLVGVLQLPPEAIDVLLGSNRYGIIRDLQPTDGMRSVVHILETMGVPVGTIMVTGTYAGLGEAVHGRTILNASGDGIRFRLLDAIRAEEDLLMEVTCLESQAATLSLQERLGATNALLVRQHIEHAEHLVIVRALASQVLQPIAQALQSDSAPTQSSPMSLRSLPFADPTPVTRFSWGALRVRYR